MQETVNGMTKSEAVKRAYELAYESEKNKLSCSQSAFHAVTAVLGLKDEGLFKSLLALQGGGANSGLNSCGAFCGPLVAFGLLFGRDYDLWRKGEMDLTASTLGEKLLAKFREAYGSALCKDIQAHCVGFSVRFLKDGVPDAAAGERWTKADGPTIVAPVVVGRAAAWAIEILWDKLPKDQEVDLAEVPSMAEAERLLEAKIANL